MFCKQTIEREGVFLSSVSSLLCVCVCGASLQQRMQGKTSSRSLSRSRSRSLSFLCSPLLSLFWCVPTTIMYPSLYIFRHAIFIRLIIHSIIMYKDYTTYPASSSPCVRRRRRYIATKHTTISNGDTILSYDSIHKNHTIPTECSQSWPGTCIALSLSLSLSSSPTLLCLLRGVDEHLSSQQRNILFHSRNLDECVRGVEGLLGDG